MLATAGRPPEGDAWAYDIKVDGWRALVHVGASRVAVYSRPGRDITAALPRLQALADVVPGGSVLDGELVAGSGGASSFYRLATLMATMPMRRPTEVSFVAFDVLALDGHRRTTAAYRERRRLLEGLRLSGPAWCTSRCWTEVSSSTCSPRARGSTWRVSWPNGWTRRTGPGSSRGTGSRSRRRRGGPTTGPSATDTTGASSRRAEGPRALLHEVRSVRPRSPVAARLLGWTT